MDSINATRILLTVIEFFNALSNAIYSASVCMYVFTKDLEMTFLVCKYAVYRLSNKSEAVANDDVRKSVSLEEMQLRSYSAGSTISID